MSRDRILVVDANPLEGASLRAALFERGFDAVEASTADGALSLIPTFGPGWMTVPSWRTRMFPADTFSDP